MNKPVLIVGALSVLLVIVRVLQHWYLTKQEEEMKAKRDINQKLYEDALAKAEQEVKDAKLTFDINKRRLSDPDSK